MTAYNDSTMTTTYNNGETDTFKCTVNIDDASRIVVGYDGVEGRVTYRGKKGNDDSFHLESTQGEDGMKATLHRVSKNSLKGNWWSTQYPSHKGEWGIDLEE